MAKISFGLDISDHSVEAVSVGHRKGALVIESYGRAEIPPGIIRRGVILDSNKLAQLLKDFFAAIFGPHGGHLAVGLGLPEQLAYSKIFTLPVNLTSDLAAKAAAIEASRIFPISLADAVTGICALSRHDNFQDYLFVAAERTVIQAYVTVIRAAGAEVAFIDLESLAIARALVPDAVEPALIADIGAQTTMLAVADRHGVTLSSNVPIAGNALTEAVEVQLNVPLDKAELMKRRAGFDPGAEKGRVFLIAQKPMAEILSEIDRTLKYFERQKLKPLRRIILAGGTSLLPGITDYVASNFPQLTVESGQPFRGMALDPQADADLKRYEILFATATGLALRAAGLRGRPGLDLRPGLPAGHGLAQIVNLAKKAVLALTNMPRVKTTASAATSEKPKRRRAAKAGAGAPPVETSPVATESAAEPKPKVDLQQAIAKLAEPDPKKAAVKAPPAGQDPVPAEPALPAEDQESDGRGVGEILGSEHDYGDSPDKTAADEPLQPLPEESHDHAPQEAKVKPHLLIDDIISRSQNKSPADSPASPPVDAETSPVMSRPSRWSGEPSRKLPVILLILLVVVLLAAAAGGVYMFAQKSGWNFGAAVNVVTSLFAKKAGAPASQPAVTTEAQAPSAVNLAFRLTTAPQPAGDKPTVVTRVIETDVTASGTFKATGSAAATTGGRASGKLRIVNTTAESYTFVATTRCLSTAGVLFRLKKATPIPANGSVEAEVTADQPGPQGDIGPTKFTIPGLSTDLQAKIWAESDSAMTGGAGGQVKAVSAGDITAAKASLSEQLKKEAEANLAAMAAKTEIVLPELIDSQELSVTAPAVGVVGEEFKLSLTVRFRALLVPEDQIVPLLEDKLKQALPPAESLADYELGKPQYFVEAGPQDDLAEVRVEASVSKSQ